MPPLAVFTIVRNEQFFFPRWLAHYAATDGDLFVLDHETDDGSVVADHPQYTRVGVVRPETDDVGWMLHTVMAYQKELLQRYDRVVFAEVDEFLCPDPHVWPTLKDYLKSNNDVIVTATGYDILGTWDAPPLDPGMPVMSQRGWKRNDKYSKTLIASVPLSWEVGFHAVQPPVTCRDPDLYLFHLHYCDKDVAWNRLVSRMKNKPPAPGSWGSQNKVQNYDLFENQFRQEVGIPGPIPVRFRACV